MSRIEGKFASMWLRKAARRAGIATLGSYELQDEKPDWYVANEPHLENGEMCAVVFTPHERKEKTIDWIDMFYIVQYGEDVKPARV